MATNDTTAGGLASYTPKDIIDMVVKFMAIFIMALLGWLNHDTSSQMQAMTTNYTTMQSTVTAIQIQVSAINAKIDNGIISRLDYEDRRLTEHDGQIDRLREGQRTTGHTP